MTTQEQVEALIKQRESAENAVAWLIGYVEMLEIQLTVNNAIDGIKPIKTLEQRIKEGNV